MRSETKVGLLKNIWNTQSLNFGSHTILETPWPSISWARPTICVFSVHVQVIIFIFTCIMNNERPGSKRKFYFLFCLEMGIGLPDHVEYTELNMCNFFLESICMYYV